MILLQSYETFRDFARVDEGTGLVLWLGSLDSVAAKEQFRNSNGVYIKIDDAFVAFYRVGPGLFFRINKQVLLLDEGVTCDVRQEGQKKTLTFFKSNEIVLSWTYDDPLPGRWFENDPTPMVEKEDFDLGLLVRNVVSDPDRMRGIFQTR
jgi:hypothetical protein